MLRLRLSSDSDGQRGLKWRQERWWWWKSSKVQHDDCCVRNHRRRKEIHLKSQTAEIHLTCRAMRVSLCEPDNCWNIWLQSSNLTQPPMILCVQTAPLTDARLTCRNCLIRLINWCIHLSIQGARHKRHMRMNHELKSLPSFGQSATPCQKTKKENWSHALTRLPAETDSRLRQKHVRQGKVEEAAAERALKQRGDRSRAGKRYSNHWNNNQCW